MSKRVRYLWRQLRFQIVAAQMLVVLVGTLTLLLAVTLLAARAVPPALQTSFREVVGQALLLAALAATAAGLFASLLLARAVLRPLRELARSSRRIAEGRYDERVTVPVSDELANVANSFNQMTDALAHVEQQRVALIGNVAHELRTPLAGLEGYLEGLQDGVLPSDPETISAMQHEVRRLRRLVSDLQELSRVEAGQVRLHVERFDLVALVQRVVVQLCPQLLTQTLDVAIEPTDANITVLADPDRTVQILVNLIGNAMRYSPEDGHITVRLTTAADQARVSVEDNGIGIPTEALPLLFERFFRVEPSRSRSSGGSGIGLTIARHLAWAMGGDLTAASAGRGQGSTFTLTLPLAR